MLRIHHSIQLSPKNGFAYCARARPSVPLVTWLMQNKISSPEAATWLYTTSGQILPLSDELLAAGTTTSRVYVWHIWLYPAIWSILFLVPWTYLWWTLISPLVSNNFCKDPFWMLPSTSDPRYILQTSSVLQPLSAGTAWQSLQHSLVLLGLTSRCLEISTT